MYRRILLIDLDGVLNNYTGDYNPKYIPPIKTGAKEFVERMSKDFDLKLFTTRSAELAKKWLDENEMGHFFSEVTDIKKPAWLLIDDRCVTFRGDFNSLTKEVENFKPWYKG